MPIAKNALTTSRPGRLLRREYRHVIRPAATDALIAARLTLRRNSRANSPSFFILGVNKAGTTALYETLVQRPEFGRPLRKEIHYFDGRPEAGDDWYRAHFWGDSSLIWGEGTPEYLEQPGALEGIRRVAPDAKLIVCLRDPVKRVVSHFHNSVDHGTESRSLERAVAEEVAQLNQGWVPTTSAELRTSYVYRSRYAETLAPWVNEFSQDQLLILISEHRAESLVRACAFLGVSVPTTEPSRSSNERSYEAPSQETVDLIRAGLVDSTSRLPQLLGWDGLPSEWIV